MITENQNGKEVKIKHQIKIVESNDRNETSIFIAVEYENSWNGKFVIKRENDYTYLVARAENFLSTSIEPSCPEDEDFLYEAIIDARKLRFDEKFQQLIMETTNVTLTYEKGFNSETSFACHFG